MTGAADAVGIGRGVIHVSEVRVGCFKTGDWHRIPIPADLAVNGFFDHGQLGGAVSIMAGRALISWKCRVSCLVTVCGKDAGGGSIIFIVYGTGVNGYFRFGIVSQYSVRGLAELMTVEAELAGLRGVGNSIVRNGKKTGIYAGLSVFVYMLRILVVAGCADKRRSLVACSIEGTGCAMAGSNKTILGRGIFAGFVRLAVRWCRAVMTVHTRADPVAVIGRVEVPVCFRFGNTFGRAVAIIAYPGIGKRSVR